MAIPNSAYSENAIPDHYTTLIQSLCDIGESYYWLGRVEDAVRLLQIGMQVVDESEARQQDLVKLLLQYGKMLIMRNFRSNSSYELIWPTLLRAQKIAESIGDDRLIADTLSLLGQAHYYKKLNTGEGEYATALKYYQQALERRESIADERGKSESLFDVGLIYERQEQYDKALDHYTQAMQIAEQHGYKLEKSYALRHTAGIYLNRGDADKALSYSLEELTLREEVGFKTGLPLSHLNVGNVHFEKKDLTHASLHYEKALELAEEMKLKMDTVLALLSIGDLRQAEGQLPQARECFEKALEVAKEINLKFAVSAASAGLEAITGESR